MSALSFGLSWGTKWGLPQNHPVWKHAQSNLWTGHSTESEEQDTSGHPQGWESRTWPLRRKEIRSASSQSGGGGVRIAKNTKINTKETIWSHNQLKSTLSHIIHKTVAAAQQRLQFSEELEPSRHIRSDYINKMSRHGRVSASRLPRHKKTNNMGFCRRDTLTILRNLPPWSDHIETPRPVERVKEEGDVIVYKVVERLNHDGGNVYVHTRCVREAGMVDLFYPPTQRKLTRIVYPLH